VDRIIDTRSLAARRSSSFARNEAAAPEKLDADSTGGFRVLSRNEGWMASHRIDDAARKSGSVKRQRALELNSEALCPVRHRADAVFAAGLRAAV